MPKDIFYNQMWFWLLVVPMLLGALAGFLGNALIVPWLFGFAAVAAFGFALRFIGEN